MDNCNTRLEPFELKDKVLCNEIKASQSKYDGKSPLRAFWTGSWEGRDLTEAVSQMSLREINRPNACHCACVHCHCNHRSASAGNPPPAADASAAALSAAAALTAAAAEPGPRRFVGGGGGSGTDARAVMEGRSCARGGKEKQEQRV